MRKKSATRCTKQRESNVKSNSIRSTWNARRKELKSELTRKSVKGSMLRGRLNGNKNSLQSLIRIPLSTRLTYVNN